MPPETEFTREEMIEALCTRPHLFAGPVPPHWPYCAAWLKGYRERQWPRNDVWHSYLEHLYASDSERFDGLLNVFKEFLRESGNPD